MTKKEHHQLTMMLRSRRATYNTANYKASAATGKAKESLLAIAEITKIEIEELEKKLS